MEPDEQNANMLEQPSAAVKDTELVKVVDHTTARSRTRTDLLLTFFHALDTAQIRYCVLHSWEHLPGTLSDDLDVAVHPDDRWKLASVFSALRDRDCAPVQVINYFAGAYAFRFAWLDGSAVRLLAIDIIFDHQRGVLMRPSAKQLIAGRRPYGAFWIAAPEAEFSYLLARRTWKRRVTAAQIRQLKILATHLGQPKVESLAAELFLRRINLEFARACLVGNPKPFLTEGRASAWKTSIVRNPLRLGRLLVLDAARRVRRWRQPTGLFVVVMGPDGSGKSTLIENLLQTFGPLFQQHRTFHWRPMLLWPPRRPSATTRPHSLPAYGRPFSMMRLLAHVLDYGLGYWFVIHPLLVRSGLVIFDRYYDDVGIDPKRYRYGGPLWLHRLLGVAVPKPHLRLVLDAPEEVILSRKQEVEPQEIRDLRRLYSEYQQSHRDCRFVDSASSIAAVAVESTRAIIDVLTARAQRQYARWLPAKRTNQ